MSIIQDAKDRLSIHEAFDMLERTHRKSRRVCIECGSGAAKIVYDSMIYCHACNSRFDQVDVFADINDLTVSGAARAIIGSRKDVSVKPRKPWISRMAPGKMDSSLNFNADAVYCSTSSSRVVADPASLKKWANRYMKWISIAPNGGKYRENVQVIAGLDKWRIS